MHSITSIQLAIQNMKSCVSASANPPAVLLASFPSSLALIRASYSVASPIALIASIFESNTTRFRVLWAAEFPNL